jgi:hypothetical protein
MAHVIKFGAFVRKNCDFPFVVKRKVFDAALMSAILYSCESWLTYSLTHARTLYMSAVKSLLGVRKTTSNDLCLVELGIPPIETLVQDCQRKLFSQLLRDREHMTDDPFWHIWILARNANTPCAKHVIRILEGGQDRLNEIKRNIQQSDKTRSVTYVSQMNPTLDIHNMYMTSCMKEHHRIVVTKLRLSSHNLAVEKGRWSRIPFDGRLCSCGKVQTEAHMIAECPSTNNLRIGFANKVSPTLPGLFNADCADLGEFCYSVMKKYI